MIALDTNVLVYSHRRESEHHEAALGLVKACAEGRANWAIPWPCIYEFYSVVTHPKIWKEAASTPDQARNQINAWMMSPTLKLLSETAQFFSILESHMHIGRVRGPVIHDARIAAICSAHGVEELLSRDRDFGLFPGLRTRDPFR